MSLEAGWFLSSYEQRHHQHQAPEQNKTVWHGTPYIRMYVESESEWVRESERERERECVCVCVIDRYIGVLRVFMYYLFIICMYVYMYVCLFVSMEAFIHFIKSPYRRIIQKEMKYIAPIVVYWRRGDFWYRKYVCTCVWYICMYVCMYVCVCVCVCVCA